MVTFSQPLFLYVGIGLGLGFFIVGVLWGRLQHLAITRFGRRQTLLHFSRFTSKAVTFTVFCLTLALLSLAAAQPQRSSLENANSPTLNAVIVMDISRSMLAEDGWEDRTRLETGILAVERLLETYPDGRFGLVLYTDQVVAYRPTFDREAIRIILEHFRGNYAHTVRGGGSAPVAALNEAATMIGELPYTIEVIFLISDGGTSTLVPHANQPRLSEVLEQLRNLQVRIVAAGVGGLIPTTIPDYDENGELVGYHMFEGAVAYTALDEAALGRFTVATSGFYLRLTDPDSLVAIASRENLDSQPTAQGAVENLVWIPTAAALLLVTLWLVGNRISFSRPRTPF